MKWSQPCKVLTRYKSLINGKENPQLYFSPIPSHIQPTLSPVASAFSLISDSVPFPSGPMAIGLFHQHLLGLLKSSSKWHAHLLPTSAPYGKMLQNNIPKLITSLLWSELLNSPSVAQMDKIKIPSMPYKPLLNCPLPLSTTSPLLPLPQQHNKC